MRKEELYRNFIGYRETEKVRKTEYLFPNSQFSNILDLVTQFWEKTEFLLQY